MAGDGNECSAGQLTITGLCDVLGDGITDSVGFLFSVGGRVRAQGRIANTIC